MHRYKMAVAVFCGMPRLLVLRPDWFLVLDVGVRATWGGLAGEHAVDKVAFVGAPAPASSALRFPPSDYDQASESDAATDLRKGIGLLLE
jgi:hypothetical protein